MAVDWIGYSCAVLVLVGGIIEYFIAGSVISLAAGLLSSLLAAVSVYLASQNPTNARLSLGTSVTLTLVMGLRILISWMFMPTGLIILSVLLLVKIISRMQNRPRQP